MIRVPYSGLFRTMNWLLLVVTICLAVLTWTSNSIYHNYLAARKTGLPIIISPVASLNPLWIITYRLFPSVLLLRWLPFGFGIWARCTLMGWMFHDKHALHQELGPVFTIVTPGGNEVIVADPQVTHTILSHRKDFTKPAAMYGMHSIVEFSQMHVDRSPEQLNVFGRNLNTVSWFFIALWVDHLKRLVL